VEIKGSKTDLKKNQEIKDRKREKLRQLKERWGKWTCQQTGRHYEEDSWRGQAAEITE
jgi:hypothetical protein